MIENTADQYSLPLSPRFLCPFLGKRYDADTYSAVRDLPNYCHKTNPAAPVSIEHQVLACTAEEYMHCPVFLATQPPVLPAEWLNSDAVTEVKKVSQRRTTLRSLTYAGIGLVAIILLVIIYRGWFSGSAAEVVVSQATNTSTSTRTITSTPSRVPSRTVHASATQAVTPTLNSSQTQEAIFLMQTATAAAGQSTQPSPAPADTQAPTATLTNCTAQIFPPVYSPAVFHPPLVVMYGSQPFLIKWKVVNTSADCTWTSMQLLTVVNDEPKMLSMMPPNRQQPVIDEEFVIRDDRYAPVNLVKPGEVVTIVIQINALSLISSNGKIDRFCDMIVNGQLVPGGKLIALQEQWAVVVIPTRTPTTVILPTREPPPPGRSATPGGPTPVAPTSTVALPPTAVVTDTVAPPP
jgi:hypothetical protein